MVRYLPYLNWELNYGITENQTYNRVSLEKTSVTLNPSGSF